MHEDPILNSSDPGSPRLVFETLDIGALDGLAEQDALALLEGSRLAEALDWLESLPEEAILCRPWLLVARGWAMVYSGELRELELVLFDAANQAVEADDPARRRLTGHIAAIRAYAISLSGDIASALVFAQAALRLLPADDYPPRGLSAMLVAVASRRLGDLEGAEIAIRVAIAIAEDRLDRNLLIGALCELSTIDYYRGRFQASTITCEHALSLVETNDERADRLLPNAGLAHIYLGRLLREWDQLDAALAEVSHGLRLSEAWGQVENLISGYWQLAWIYQALRDERRAFDALHRVEELSQGLPYFKQWAAALEAQLNLSFGNIEQAAGLTSQIRSSEEEGVSFDEWFFDLVVARSLIALGKQDQALYLLQSQLPMLEKAGAGYPLVAVLVIQALALAGQGLEAQALAALGRALNIAEPEGLVRVFIDEGAPIRSLLRRAIDLQMHAAFARRLLAAIHDEQDSKRNGGPALYLEAALTNRELEILCLMASGCSNPVIAERLFLSINTVKSHTKSLYGKMGVRSRQQAIAQAERLGLI